MTNLPLFLLFWTAVPLAIYRSQRRWRTFFIMLASWFGIALLLVIGLAVLTTVKHPERAGPIASDVAFLVAILVTVWHSHKTRKASSGASPPSAIV